MMVINGGLIRGNWNRYIRESLSMQFGRRSIVARHVLIVYYYISIGRSQILPRTQTVLLMKNPIRYTCRSEIQKTETAKR